MASDRGGLPHPRIQGLAFWGYIGISLALIGVYLASAGHDVNQSIIYVASNLAAALAILMGIRLHRPKRPEGWYWLAAGQAAFLAGNVRWYVVPAAAGRPTPFPSYADWAFLAGAVITAFAILLFIRARRAGSDWSALLDALVVTATFSSVFYVLVVAPKLAASDLPLLGVLIAGAYPFVDAVLVMLVSRLLFGAGRTDLALVLLAAWATTQLLADTTYGILQVGGSLRDGSLPFYGYMAAALLVGAAALHPTMRDIAVRSEVAPQPPRRSRMVVIGLCGLTVPALVINEVRQGQRVEPIVLACATAIMFILLMLRVADLLAKTKAAARQEHRQLQQFLEAIPIGVCVRDAVTEEPAYVNRVASELLGYDPGTVASPYDLPNLYLSGTDEPYPPGRLPIAHALRGQTASVDNLEVAVNHTRRRLNVVGTPIREADRVRYAVTAFADITAERQMAEELRKLADIDPLTGVNNRRGFLVAARTQLARVQQERRGAALLFVDLDGLKSINDTHGHGIGDQAIRLIASLLTASVRRSDVVGRIGGDEFCALLPDVSTSKESERWVRRLRAQVDVSNSSNLQPHLTITVGSAIFDPAAPSTVEELMERADEAMYHARHERDRARPGGPPIVK
jgi:diguanylate cyclase (GGDEF)-like protein